MSSEEEEFQFEYESDEESEPVSFRTIPAAAACSTDPPLQDVEIENQYYNAKGQRADNPEEALSGFSIVISMQDEKGEWGFKALASMVKLNFAMKKTEEMLEKCVRQPYSFATPLVLNFLKLAWRFSFPGRCMYRRGTGIRRC